MEINYFAFHPTAVRKGHFTDFWELVTDEDLEMEPLGDPEELLDELEACLGTALGTDLLVYGAARDRLLMPNVKWLGEPQKRGQEDFIRNVVFGARPKLQDPYRFAVGVRANPAMVRASSKRLHSLTGIELDDLFLGAAYIDEGSWKHRKAYRQFKTFRKYVAHMAASGRGMEYILGVKQSYTMCVP